MNNKTAKLLRKTASAMVFVTYQESGQKLSRKKIYNNLKKQWYAASDEGRAKSRAEMKRLVTATFRKPSGPEE